MRRSGCPHHEQTTGWARVKQIYGWTPTWIWVSRGQTIVSGAIVLTRKMGPFVTIGYVVRGPVWAEHDRNAMELAIQAVCGFARSRRIAYLIVLPPYKGGDIIPLLAAEQFRQKPDHLPPVLSTAMATLLVDLQPEPDVLLAAMSMTKRQNIRRGLRKGVKVRTGDGADAETLRRLMWLACKRRGVSPSPRQADFFERLWNVLSPSGTLQFFIADIDGAPVSAACTIVTGDSMQLWRVGWSGTHDDYKPNDVLHWEAMKWARSHGCRRFDFMHFEPNHARAILGGRKLVDSHSGVTEFKRGFGGQLHLLPEPYYRSFQPAVHGLLRTGGSRLLESISSTAAARRILKSVSQW